MATLTSQYRPQPFTCNSCYLNTPTQTDTFTMPATMTTALPSQQTIDTCGDFLLKDANGKTHTFRSLYENGPQRTLFVLVRHFYCGMCQEYLRKLSASFTAKGLEALQTPTQIIVIGCGEPELINEYAARSDCIFPIYTDRSRKLYSAFNMMSTTRLGTKPQYQADVTLTDIVVKSFIQAAGAGIHTFKSGNYNQVGGEMLIENGRAAWCHRMRSTRDHTEIEDLRQVLGA